MTQALVAQGHVASGGTGGWSPESRVRVCVCVWILLGGMVTQALVAQGHVTSGGTGGWSPESRVGVRFGSHCCRTNKKRHCCL